MISWIYDGSWGYSNLISYFLEPRSVLKINVACGTYLLATISQFLELVIGKFIMLFLLFLR